MDILRSGTRPTKKASSEYFTGTVWQEPIVESPEPARVRAIRVTFEPGRHDSLAYPPVRTNALRVKRYWFGRLKGRTSKNYQCK